MKRTARKDFTLGSTTYRKGKLYEFSVKEAKELEAASLIFPDKVGGENKASKQAQNRKTK